MEGAGHWRDKEEAWKEQGKKKGWKLSCECEGGLGVHCTYKMSGGCGGLKDVLTLPNVFNVGG